MKLRKVIKLPKLARIWDVPTFRVLDEQGSYPTTPHTHEPHQYIHAKGGPGQEQLTLAGPQGKHRPRWTRTNSRTKDPGPDQRTRPKASQEQQLDQDQQAEPRPNTTARLFKQDLQQERQQLLPQVLQQQGLLTCFLLFNLSQKG